MKTFVTVTLALVMLGGAASAQETRDFDGCLGVKVEGTNYYNLVDPRCKTASEQFQSSGADERRRLREEEERAKKS